MNPLVMQQMTFLNLICFKKHLIFHENDLPAEDSNGISSVIIPRRSRRDIVLASSVHSVRPSVLPSGTISQYLLVRFDSFLVQMISTMDSQTSNKFGQNQPLNT